MSGCGRITKELMESLMIFIGMFSQTVVYVALESKSSRVSNSAHPRGSIQIKGINHSLPVYLSTEMCIFTKILNAPPKFANY